MTKPNALPTSRTARAAAIGNDFAGDRRSLAAVFPIYVLEDFLAALVFEVYIYVRRFIALAADESLEE